MNTFSITDTGVLRTMNQDYCFSSDTPIGNLPNLYIVCDGMGGHKAGEYASRYTVERIVASVSRSQYTEPVRILKEAIKKANEIFISIAVLCFDNLSHRGYKKRARDRTRTDDLRITNASLYQLSHFGK